MERKYFNTSVEFVDNQGRSSWGAWGHDDPETGDFVPVDPRVKPYEVNHLSDFEEQA